jgi:hypothetical protein
VHNFGKNVSYEPRYRYTPRTEEDVLGILAAHHDGRIRAQGAGHSWSRIVEATDVVVNLAHFSGVTVERGTVGHVARVGAGATIEKILASRRSWQRSAERRSASRLSGPSRGRQSPVPPPPRLTAPATPASPASYEV